MRLEQAIFDGIIKTLGAVPEDHGELRRRRVQRYHVDREVSIKAFGVANASSRSVTLVNISQQGLCIVDRLTISSGDRFIVMLPLAGGGIVNVLCTARQSRLTSLGAFRVGAEFTSEVERDTRIIRGADGLVAASSQSADEMHQPATLRRVYPKAGDKPVTIEVRNFAEGMFETVSPEPISPGEEVYLEFRFQQRVQTWKCTTVTMRAAAGGVYKLGIRNDGPANTAGPPQQKGLKAWLKGMFG